ncbi:MAG: hypothetical protein JJU29_19945 [Verrucomicrobia bacterium]|nr:hypothetical protein [Verrucomicrobiota bacterium]MCH8513562.1 hypothetical protein [Kiritimatiellia bacterium]
MNTTSNSKPSHPSSFKSGITRREVLLLLLGLGIMIALILPLVFHVVPPPAVARTRMMNNGRQIYLSVMARMLESVFHANETYWPSSAHTPYTPHPESSTDYFNWLMEVDVLYNDPSLFQAPRVPQLSPGEILRAEHNPWSVVMDLGPEIALMDDPFLFSRNLNETALRDWSGDKTLRLEQMGHHGPGQPHIHPFDDRHLVVVNFGGGGQILSRNRLLWHNLNPNARTQPILEP